MKDNKMNFEIGEINKTPLRESIANSIRVLIVKGELEPGERLMEPIIAEQLGVSRTPIREAFFQLWSEGLVKVMPRKGAIVSNISINDAEELAILGSVLEGLAARLCCKNISGEILDKLKSINEKLFERAKQETDNFVEITEINNEFHDIINRSSCNNKLYQMIEIVRKQTARYEFIYLSALIGLKVSVKSTIEEHEEIIKALSIKDIEKVESLMRKHLENSGKRLCDYMREGNLKERDLIEK